jgi:hypothetical protein
MRHAVARVVFENKLDTAKRDRFIVSVGGVVKADKDAKSVAPAGAEPTIASIVRYLEEARRPATSVRRDF